MKIVLLAICALNIFCGWLPSDTNAVDAPSMVNFAMAAACAYCAGIQK